MPPRCEVFILIQTVRRHFQKRYLLMMLLLMQTGEALRLPIHFSR
jgi:hypothetical protein